MPHTVRKRSESGFYHVVAKGAGGQVIFEGPQDRSRCLAILGKEADENGVDIHAFCLMSNHIHLLVGDEAGKLSDFMRKFCAGYAMHFNRTTGRTGSVFVRPFWNEAVKCDEYFLSALRYIHANPEPAGICAAAEYPWSSYRAYLGADSFVKTDLALGMLGGAAEFEAFSASGSKFALPFPSSKLRGHLMPDELWNVAVNLIGGETLRSIRSLEARDRKPILEALSHSGLTEREIVRVTGLGKTAVHRSLAA